MIGDFLNNTTFLVGLTSVVSIMAFRNEEMFNKLKFNPYMVLHHKEYGRVFSHALLHSGWLHLAINMYVLWSFGRIVEEAFQLEYILGGLAQYGRFFFVLMYVLAIPVSALPALIKHKNSQAYNSVGASGAVSAVVFTLILLAPTSKMGIILIPMQIPAVILGAAYLIYSYIMSRRGNDRIAHDAHFAGAVFGFVFPLILNPKLILHFYNSIMSAL